MVVLQLCRWKFSHKETFSRLYSTEVDFWPKKRKKCFWATLSGLRGNIHTPSILLCKSVVNFIFVIIELFAISYGWDVISGNRSKSCVFRRGVGNFQHRFQREGASPTNHCWYQKIRVIAVSWVIKISTVHHLVLSTTYVWRTDRQTNRRTDRTATAIPCVALHAIG